jgi:tetratricopeptide (TPR) repeat protein
MASNDRAVRVFISSTFRDMQAERDHLVKFVFPELRRLCETRGVTWGEVDLRWGVTDEEAAEGKVLPICLEEIKRCRPYFLCLLGERYGWIPQTLEPELLKREPWLREHVHGRTSVTELEILHGVLNNPAMAERAFFYFRDPQYITAAPADHRQDLAAEDAQSRAKLHALKDRIRQAYRDGVLRYPPQENYAGHQALGELVRADLGGVIDELYPPDQKRDPLDRDAADHAAYAQSRLEVYIGRPEYLQALDAHTAGAGQQPLIVLGEPGSGKSALLANWTAHYRLKHPETLVIEHYIGATAYSADWAAMLRRLMGELQRNLGIQQKIPGKRDELQTAFANWLHMAAAKGRVVLVLDALDKLEDRDGAPDLVWLPHVLPENVALFVSTLPGRALDEVRKRGWPTLELEALIADEQRELIGQCLAQHGKSLSPSRLERIVAEPQSANPLYLRVLIDELRVFGIHEQLDQRIRHYLKAQSPDELYKRVIARWDEDYGGKTNVVGKTLSLLWGARRGLSETELLEALGNEGQPFPRAAWSPLFLAMSGALVNRSGLLSFAHDFLREAARAAFLKTDSRQRKIHLSLAGYFERQAGSSRRRDELPWQLAAAGEWQRLQALLTRRDVFIEGWMQNQFDLKDYWTQIEACSSFRIVDAYREQIEHPEAEPVKEFLWILANVLSTMGHPAEAISLQAALVNYYRSTNDWDMLQSCLGSQGVSLEARGDLDQAMALYKEQERICRQVKHLEGLGTSLGNQGVILQIRGDWDAAMTLHKEEESIWRGLGNLDGLQICLGNQGLILNAGGDPDGAMALHQQEEQICRRLGNVDSLQRSLGNQGLILSARGELDGAMALYKEQEQICRRLGNLESLQRAFVNQGNILQARGNLSSAMTLYREAEQICRRLGNLDGLQRSLGNQGSILLLRGDLDAALSLYKEQERLCQQLGNLSNWHVCLANQGAILHARGDLKGALALYKEAERSCQLGDVRSCAIYLSNQGTILQQLGEYDAAMSLYLESEQIYRQLPDPEGLADSLGSQGRILHIRGEVDRAMTLYKDAEQVFRQLKLVEPLVHSLTTQALALRHMQRAAEGLSLAEEAVDIAIKHGYAALAKQIQPIVDAVRRAANS